MNRYILTFRGENIESVKCYANDHAAESGDTIISADLSFTGSGTAFESPVLTCVFERKELPEGEEFIRCPECAKCEFCGIVEKALARSCGCKRFEEATEKKGKKAKK
jgi:hypothetical protein